MSPRFEFDPSAVRAGGLEVLPKDEYEFQVGEPKAFIRKNRKGEDSYGIRYPLVVKGPPEYEGKRQLFSTYYQSEGAQAMAKQFIMAVLGYGKKKEDEARFDSDMRGQDWGFDPDTGAVGDMYRQLTGKRVYGSVDVTQNDEDGSDMQQFKGWRPIGSGPR